MGALDGVLRPTSGTPRGVEAGHVRGAVYGTPQVATPCVLARSAALCVRVEKGGPWNNLAIISRMRTRSASTIKGQLRIHEAPRIDKAPANRAHSFLPKPKRPALTLLHRVNYVIVRECFTKTDFFPRVLFPVKPTKRTRKPTDSPDTQQTTKRMNHPGARPTNGWEEFGRFFSEKCCTNEKSPKITRRTTSQNPPIRSHQNTRRGKPQPQARVFSRR